MSEKNIKKKNVKNPGSVIKDGKCSKFCILSSLPKSQKYLVKSLSTSEKCFKVRMEK